MSFYLRDYKGTEYKYVCRYTNINGKFVWCANVLHQSKVFKDIKQAAKWVDVVLIQNNKNPVNILKRKI